MKGPRARRSLLPGIAVAFAVMASLTSGHPAQDPAGDRDQTLRAIEEVLSGDETLDPMTRQALLDLVNVLRADASAASQGQPGAAPSRGEVARAVDDYLDARLLEATQTPSTWERVFQDLSLYGDLRLRQEADFHRDGREDRNRTRLRLRLGGTYELDETLRIGARLVTGDPDDPNSTHVTFGDVFNSLDISLDRAFLDWQPTQVEGLKVRAGKFAHDFVANPVYGELVWDGDVQPEGLAGTYTVPGDGLLQSLGIRVGQYVILEQNNAKDGYLTAAQLSGRIQPIAEWVANAALAYYHYCDVSPDGTTTILMDNAGNAMVDLNGDGNPDEFRSRFRILDSLLSAQTSVAGRPLVVSTQYINNLTGKDGRDEGWAFGAAYGSTRQKGGARLYYQWQVVEQDAVFSPFAQDDFLFQTNHRSHVVGIQYQVTDRVGAHLWSLISARDHRGTTATSDSNKDQWRVRLDIDVKF